MKAYVFFNEINAVIATKPVTVTHATGVITFGMGTISVPLDEWRTIAKFMDPISGNTTIIELDRITKIEYPT